MRNFRILVSLREFARKLIRAKISTKISTCERFEFALPPKKINFADYMTPFELLFRKVKHHKLDILKVDLKRIAYASFHRYNFLRELNLSLPEFQALKKLSSNKDIVIHKSDKGNSVVIVDRKDYIKKSRT